MKTVGQSSWDEIAWIYDIDGIGIVEISDDWTLHGYIGSAKSDEFVKTVTRRQH